MNLSVRDTRRCVAFFSARLVVRKLSCERVPNRRNRQARDDIVPRNIYDHAAHEQHGCRRDGKQSMKQLDAVLLIKENSTEITRRVASYEWRCTRRFDLPNMIALLGGVAAQFAPSPLVRPPTSAPCS